MKKILVILLSCLSVGAVANAAGTAVSEVQIAIEGTEAASTHGKRNKPEQKSQSVQTGDEAPVAPFWLIVAMSVVLGSVCIWKKKRRNFAAVLIFLLALFFADNPAYAAEAMENVSVTVPSTVSVLFDETGEYSVSDFTISNRSLIPITVEKVNATECNGWSLCDVGEQIPVNTKKVTFVFEGQCIKAGENTLDITIRENCIKNCSIQLGRGAWTTTAEAESALRLEFEYAVGKKEFQINFDTNGGEQTVNAQKACNGDAVELPGLDRERYALEGWEDADGNLYTEQFVMPIGDVTLTAKWKEKVAYAIYIESDSSLRFVCLAEPIAAGDVYDGMTVTDVYTGFEQETYHSETQVPWYDMNYYRTRTIRQVIVEGLIQPISTAHWFQNMYDCEKFELEKLDTSKVTDMSYMFASAGLFVGELDIESVNSLDVSNVENMSHTFSYMGRDCIVLYINLNQWDVSKVKDMSYMFAGSGYYSICFEFEDLSQWNVSNVTDMTGMFRQTGYTTSWYLNCQEWDVRNVVSYEEFALDVSSNIVEPLWVN